MRRTRSAARRREASPSSPGGGQVKIRGIRAVTVRVPLPRPLVMGTIRYADREYLVVEVTSDEGVSGVGFGMTRDVPLAAIVDRNIAPLLIGEDPRDTERAWQRVYDANLRIARGGPFMGALSAVDIALWDLKARALGAPVWRLLGGYRDRVPVQVAGCYPDAAVTLADLAAEVADYAGRGFTFIKVAAGPIDGDTARLRAARDAAPGAQLGYDVHWAWRDIMGVVPVIRRWADLDLAVIEDPFPAELQAPIAHVKAVTGIPLALGEDYVGRWAFNDLIRSGLADVLRVDATAAGGISEVAKVVALAAAHGLPVSPHVLPEVHVHLAAAFGNVRTVEMTDPAYGYEGLHSLFASWVRLERGEMLAPDTPGLGVEIDWGAVDAYRSA